MKSKKFSNNKIPFAQNNLGGQVFWRAAHSPRPLVNLLGEAKVGDLDMASFADEEVLGLEVSVDDVL